MFKSIINKFIDNWYICTYILDCSEVIWLDIKKLITKIKTSNDCIVYAPCGIPSTGQEHILPDDLKEFYNICGGITFYSGSDNVLTIVPPSEFKLANPIIVGELCEDDISSNWYIIGKYGSDYITIDLDKNRLGKCYDSFWDRHGIPGECMIIATSFTDLIERLISSDGKLWYWLRDDFISLGDAYDEIEI
mgnify:CR=1 FL=1